MAAALPSYSFVAFPSHAEGGHVLFGKNSTRPKDEVQEVVYVPAATHPPESEVQCTYVAVAQAPRTHSVMLSKPAWMWGAEMGANEHGVCIASEAVVTKEAAPGAEALLGTDLVRLALERSVSAKDALEVIASLLEEHGQGGNHFEDGSTCHAFQSAFLIVDQAEAWVLETTGRYWAAEKIIEGSRCVCSRLQLTTKLDAEHPELRDHAVSEGWWDGQTEFNFAEVFSTCEEQQTASCTVLERLEKAAGPITAQTMIDILRDEASAPCADAESFVIAASMVSVLPQRGHSPCVHFFTGTPDPSRSIFKPFIFVDGVKQVPKVHSPCLGDIDPARREPRFQEIPDRRHELYKAHERARSAVDDKICGNRIPFQKD
ncbi:secernin-1 isoform X3 [Ambystoma mexicanum]|uniref:secernin-1 isoform X3 n=1 Tax=Ambystoma mexicanum TaxID=8296 RepID=UPI0037E8141D